MARRLAIVALTAASLLAHEAFATPIGPGIDQSGGMVTGTWSDNHISVPIPGSGTFTSPVTFTVPITLTNTSTTMAFNIAFNISFSEDDPFDDDQFTADPFWVATVMLGPGQTQAGNLPFLITAAQLNAANDGAEGGNLEFGLENVTMDIFKKVIPEPSTARLAAMGLLLLAAGRRRSNWI